MRECLRLAYDREPIAVRHNGVLRRRLVKLLRLPSRLRLRWHYYDFPVEIRALSAARTLLRPATPSVQPG